jgi:hypothetical protein
MERLKSSRLEDILRLSLPSFELKTKHDLLANPELFGLGLLTDTTTSHLPRLSPIPLAISDGAQDVLARFFAEGFEAAAVTAFGAMPGSAPPKARYDVTYVSVDFDCPFGFLAVHRPSRLAVVAGWVRTPFKRTDVRVVGSKRVDRPAGSPAVAPTGHGILNPLLSRYKRPRIRPDRPVSGCPLASEMPARAISTRTRLHPQIPANMSEG